jgi:hypothetical protein
MFLLQQILQGSSIHEVLLEEDSQVREELLLLSIEVLPEEDLLDLLKTTSMDREMIRTTGETLMLLRM